MSAAPRYAWTSATLLPAGDLTCPGTPVRPGDCARQGRGTSHTYPQDPSAPSRRAPFSHSRRGCRR